MPDESQIHEAMNRMVRKIVEEQYRLVEEACERALQSGKHGVLVVRGQDGLVVSAEPDESVPYGQLHERPLD